MNQSANLTDQRGVGGDRLAYALRFVLLCLAHLMFRIRIEGRHHLPRQGPALIVANHVSFADAVLVGCTTPRLIRFLMWRPYYETSGATMFFRMLHAIPVSEKSPKETVRALRAARAELAKGELVGIFPEGSISRSGQIQPFERGFERVVHGVAAPVIPVHLEGVYGHPLSYSGGGFFKNWRGAFRPRVTVRIGEPISPPVSAAELRQLVIDLASGDAVPT